STPARSRRCAPRRIPRCALSSKACTTRPTTKNRHGRRRPMETDRRLSVVVGFFVIGALALFGAAVLSLTAQRGPWLPRYTLVAYFTNGQRLIDGAPVRLPGEDGRDGTARDLL